MYVFLKYIHLFAFGIACQYLLPVYMLSVVIIVVGLNIA